MAVRTRKNVWSLPEGDDTLEWYARAVEQMKQKPIADPTSWRYQAAIHAYRRDADPLADPGDVLPSATEQRRFWTQCQHQSWFFLPWHRMYLHHFEKIVAAEVVRQGGPSDWALPYWNYSEGAESALLPEAFRPQSRPDGVDNPLWAPRNPDCNEGNAFADRRDVDLDCLTEPVFFSATVGTSTSFGGPVTQFAHRGPGVGSLERIPHGSMHVAVGSPGWMGAFETAALDPVFWLHHANIDRLWEVWLQRDPGHVNPTVGAWSGSVSFRFHDATGAIVQMTSSQVVDTTAAPLEYRYDDVSDPIPAPLAAGPAGATQAVTPMASKAAPELVGATTKAFVLDDSPTHVTFAAPAATAKPAVAAASSPSPGGARVFLNIENLTGTDQADAYDVYLNVPQDADPTTHEESYAGRLPMFGLAETSRSDEQHPGTGLNYVLDVSAVAERLAAQQRWDPAALRVSFVPAARHRGGKVRVGRVSLFRG